MATITRAALEVLITAVDTHIETSGAVGTGINTNGVRAITGDMVNKALNASMGMVKLATDLKDSYFNLTDDDSDDITEGAVNLFMSVAQEAKLDTIGNSAATGALADAYLLARANHTGTQLLTTISDVTITAADLNSLDSGADSTLHYHASDRDRANHTGTQLAATISDFNTAVNAAISGFTGTGAYTNFTITNGIVTAAS
jgi:hypothetical protein